MSTICAVATAPEGAIGIVRTSGPDALAITDCIFKGRTKAADAPPYTILHGEIIDGSETVDDVLVSVFRAPHSYTGEDATEISCHASPYILGRVVTLLTEHGCTLAEPGEFTKRAFLNGKMDLTQAEAVADLIAAQNAASHRVALTQMRGQYGTKLRELRDRLTRLAALLTLELDFSEEDVVFADREELLRLAVEIYDETGRLASSFRQGNAIKNGISVAIVGQTNVGKSTLLNALLGCERAIVSDEQGTTRDTLEEVITINNVAFRFIDTAGIRSTDNKVEKLGIERTLDAARKADIIILLTEPGKTYPDLCTNAEQTVIRIVNKTDTFQALNNIGVETLRRQLIDAAGKYTDNTDSILVTNIRHFDALTQAHKCIGLAIETIRAHATTDIIAEELRQATDKLDEILGQITSTDILNHIFSHFCIGK
ncbi:MAG: tRNA uridine-5-carboxymethylaminomethyl(34) synthesis GTPase MnmE [Prevotella sp.]|nr:tRNA uridine-5-carboxymethylaminomethyl(34) synthesis GTPase MnmE [Prevotella sp.]